MKSMRLSDFNKEMLRSETLNCFDLILLGLGSCLGVGVFVLLGDVSKNVVGPAIIISIVIAGIAAILAGICFAEFGVLHLKANSVYVYSYSSFNENIAFIFGWAIIVQYVTEIASAAKGIILFVDGVVDNKIFSFLKEVVPMNFFFTASYFDFASLCLIIAVILLMVVGVKNFLMIKKIFTACSAALLIIIIIVGSFKADSNNWNLERIPETGIEGGFIPFGFCGVIKGAAIMFYGFTGFEAVGVSGKEVEQIQKNLPIATLITLLAAVIGYMCVGALLTLMIPYHKLNGYAALPLAFDQVELNWMKWLIIFGVFFAFQTSLFSAMHFLSHIISAMANDRLLFRFLGIHNSKTKIPVSSIVLGGLISAAATAIFSFEQLVNLTVAATLFVCTILALNTIFLRYTSKIKEEEGKLSENHTKLFTEKKSFLKMLVQNFYELTSQNLINVTKKIVYWNLFFFCLSSIGLSVIFIIFTDSLLKCALEAILPACAFLIIMLLNLFIIHRQAEFNKNLPYKIPFVPITPCLSIFLNIFLMVSLDNLSWSLFLIWMILGIIPHLFWIFLKRCKKQIREPSHYEINRINMIKLNESIWKIKSQKKSFYEGTVNLVFNEDGESSFSEMQNNYENKREKKHTEKILLQLKQAEIIQTADLVVTEKVEPLTNECQSKYMNVNNIEIETSECLQLEDEGVPWQCVAEIHAKEDFPQESVVLEIVDNSYNFLSEGGEELVGDENLLKNSSEKSKEAVEELTLKKLETKNNDKLNIKQEEPLIPNSFSPKHLPSFEDSITKKTMNCNPAFKEELLQEVCKRMNTRHLNFNQERNSKFLKPIATNEDFEFETTPNVSSDVQGEMNQREILNLNTSKECKDQNEVDILILETLYEASKSEIIHNFMNNKKENLEIKEPITKQDEQKKIKEFKEKLNQLLKDQVINSSVTKALILSSPNNKIEAEKEDSLINSQENDGPYKSIKTLNKSQIKNKLELLLSKGPPKRPSLKNSFNLELKEGNSSQAEKLEDEGKMKILKEYNISDEKSSKLMKDEIDLVQGNDTGKKILLGIEN